MKRLAELAGRRREASTMAMSRWRSFRRKGSGAESGLADERDAEESKQGYLTKQAIFRDLPAPEIERISKMTRMVTTRKGQVFYVPGETGEVLFLLKEGRVELYRLTPDGRKLTIDIVGPGTFFGDMACIGQNMQDSFAEAAQDALVCVMSRNDVQKLMLDKPTVGLRILEAVGQRLVEMTTRLEETAFLGAQERVAALLLRLAVSRDGVLLVEGYSHQDLAYMLGTYRETVTNALDHLKAEGMIEVGRKRVTILHPDRVQEITQDPDLQ
ncbi:MAG: Crp/Fnr family transcriptional regulator [Chloroflexota bacterium]